MTTAFLSSSAPPERTDPDVRRSRQLDRDEQQFAVWLNQDCIGNFELIRSSLSNYCELPTDWSVVYKENFALFVNINISSVSSPTIVCSFKVFDDFTVQCFDDKAERSPSELCYLLGPENKLSRWSQISNICSHLSNVCDIVNVENTLQQILIKMKILINESKCNDNMKLTISLKFIREQLNLLYMTQKRYSSELLMTSYKLYCSSRFTYIFYVIIF